MKKVAREIGSLVLGVPGIVLLGYGISHIIDIGSCASGGPYVIARPCPEGSDGLFWATFVGGLLWIAGIIMSPRAFMAPGAGQLLWVAGFAGGGAALLVKVLTQPELDPDARLGASIVAATFLPMGLAVGVVGIVQLIKRRRTPRPAAPRRAAPTPGDRFKTLNVLRSTGALTRAEFDALKPDLDQSDPKVDRIALIRQLADERNAGTLGTEEFKAAKLRLLPESRA